MRKIATNPDSNAEFRRAMIYEPGDGGVFVFLYRLQEDGPCDYDFWYEDAAGAERHVAIEFGGIISEWKSIADPLPGCEHDWIAPTRAIRDENGWLVAGKFEAWIPD